MNNAPETIWASTGLYYEYVTDWTEGEWFVDNDLGVEYRRADLPATDAQIMDNPKVQALKRHLEIARLWLDVDGRFDLQGIDAALAACEAGNE